MKRAEFLCDKQDFRKTWYINLRMIYHGSCTGVCWLMHTGLGARQEAQTDALNAVGWDQPVQDLEALVAQRIFDPLDSS